jgi:hypothetical protein
MTTQNNTSEATLASVLTTGASAELSEDDLVEVTGGLVVWPQPISVIQI